MVERDEASPKLGIPNPGRSGNRILGPAPAASNNRNQGKCLGTKPGALQIKQKNGKPYHPQTQGKVERFHYTLKLALASKIPAQSLDELNSQLKEIIEYYNCQMRVFGTGVLGTRYCRVPGSWYRAEGYVGPGR